MKLRSGCNNFDDQTRSGKFLSIDSEALIHAIETNPMSSTWRVSGVLGMLQFSIVRYLHDLDKISGGVEFSLKLQKYCKNFDSP